MTSGKGTPVGVDLSVPPGMRSAIALVLAGPVIWSVHFMVVYLAVEAGCTGEGPGFRALGPPVPTVVTLAATALAAAACLACAAWGIRRWRADRDRGGDGGGIEPPDHGGHLALVGWLLSLLGLVTVIAVGVPALVLPAC